MQRTVQKSRVKFEYTNPVMHVPEHISFTGEEMNGPGSAGGNHRVADRERLMELMNVPERIVLTGGEGYKGYASNQRDDRYDNYTNRHPAQNGRLADLPETLTIGDEHVPTTNTAEEMRSESSIAIEENPLQELKIMRRQMGTISQRLVHMERDMEDYKSTQKTWWAATLLGFAAVVLMLIRR